MRLGGERESANVEDRRGIGIRGGGLAVGGGLGTVVLIVLALLFGVDPGVILSGGGSPEVDRPAVAGGRAAPGERAEDDEARRLVARVLASTEDTWGSAFAQAGRRYEDPTLVLFSGATQTGCGFAQATVGPFYCPPDRRPYLDLDFLADMQRRLGATGDFATAYVIAHEVGHHVQNLLGVLPRVDALRRQVPEGQANALSVRIELQADCLAGVWARRADAARPLLERGDVEEGLNAAAAVGDDRLQRAGRGQVVPESFTHGSSAQRVAWFRRGLERGEIGACDTFAGGPPPWRGSRTAGNDRERESARQTTSRTVAAGTAGRKRLRGARRSGPARWATGRAPPRS
ncbi:KPN_02809 family neutral zinc metallopeptidase [Caldovatus aquaticus]|uniref:Zinc metallopeptidase n=1 Tax=Caldovatus aquaticus TaxID=2865671 RepID=A0ABS7F5Q5_9PROT|nr:neutral zinc metallopeptidase [Caldovatus aquaticus]MBW8270941.1 zinc metallopeptidase [Caldovatus aquaticus]